MPADKGKESFFVIVKNPVEVRRNMLESTKQLIQGMQRYERFKELRNTKSELTDHLRGLVREIDSQVTKLKLKLPKLNMTKQELAQFKKKQVAAEAEKPTMPVAAGQARRSEIEVLEDQLNSIESQLVGLK